MKKLPAIDLNLRLCVLCVLCMAVRPASAAPHGSVQAADLSVLPEQFQVVFRDTQTGGYALYGTLNSGATSAQSVLVTFLQLQGSRNRRALRLFDGLPQLQAVVADRPDHNLQALFSATRLGTPVLGVISLSVEGKGSLTLLYDRADAFATSFDRLRKGLAETAGRRSETPLYPMTLADGSAISLPQGWYVKSTGRGSVDLAGPNDEGMSLGAAASVYSYVQPLPYMPPNYVLQAPCCDPVRAYVALFPQMAAGAQRLGVPPSTLERIVESAPTPWPNGQAAYILVAVRQQGRPYLHYYLVVALPGYTDPWTIYISGFSAPEGIFRQEFPMMLKVWGSYSVNPAIFAERLQHAAQAMKATNEMMRATMANTSRIENSCNEGWDQVIRGVQTIENTRTGERATFPNTLAQRLADSLSADTGQPWRIVPASELIPR
jgi:hypothetical protein